jgi:hypothetical protein
VATSSPQKPLNKYHLHQGSDSDTEFSGDSNRDGDDNSDLAEAVDMRKLGTPRRHSAQGTRTKAKAKSPKSPKISTASVIKQKSFGTKSTTPKKKTKCLTQPKSPVSKNTPKKPGNSTKSRERQEHKPKTLL